MPRSRRPIAPCGSDKQQNGVPNILRKIKPNLRNRLDLRVNFGSALTVSRRVIWRQRLPRCAAKMQRPCSVGLVAVFASSIGVVAYFEIPGGFDSRRLHWMTVCDRTRITATTHD